MDAPLPILFEGAADHVTKGAIVIGRVVVTSASIRFGSHVPAATHVVDIALPHVARVGRCSVASLSTNGIEIDDGHGRSYRFLVEDPAAWVRALEAIVATYGRSSAYR